MWYHPGMPSHAQESVGDLLHAIGVPFETDVPLGPRTWYGIGGIARCLAHPRDAAQLTELVAAAQAHATPLRVLGKGANLLVAADRVDGIVVALDAEAFRRIEVDVPNEQAVAGGGADLERLITATVRAGLGGLEILAGIPATVGGALRMNAGGAFGEIGPTVERLTAVSVDGRLETLERTALEFRYRHSNLGDRIVVDACFTLCAADDPAALRQRLKEVMRYKKHSQPMAADSAGCVFKNPKGQSDKGAGQLIDEAGLKGHRVGGAEISTVHANFVVAHDGATAADILAVLDHAQRVVREQFGVELEREMVVWS